MNEGMEVWGRKTHNFELDGLTVAFYEHRHPMINGLIARAVVRQHQREIQGLISTIYVVIPFCVFLVFDFLTPPCR